MFLILPVDRSVGECLVKGSTCAPLPTSVPPLDLSQEPARKRYGAAAADRTPTLKSVTVSPNTKDWNRANLSHNSSVTRKRKVYELNVRPLENMLGTLIYLVVFLSWLLQARTRGLHPTVHVPSSGGSLTWRGFYSHFG